MNITDKYFSLCYTERIHEFAKIDQYKKWSIGQARKKYKSLDEFYRDELNINVDELNQLRIEFKNFNDLYSKYFNEQRKGLFLNPQKLLKWYERHNKSCNYCGITQPELHTIVKLRNGNLTLNHRTKRSKGVSFPKNSTV